MSWDVLLQKFPEGTARPEDVPDDYLPPAVGSRAEVASALKRLLRNVDRAGDSFLALERTRFAVQIDLGDEEPCSQLLLNVHDDHAEATKTILRIADRFGMRAIDCSSGDFLEARPAGRASRSARAKRSRAGGTPGPRASALPPPLTELPGMVSTPACVRYVYLSLLPGESPKRQQNAVFREYLQLLREHPGLDGGIMGPSFLFTLPDGQPFGDFRLARYPAMVTETEAEMIPRVQKMAKLMHAYAAAAGRLCGEVENGATFVCDDGRLIPLAECTFGKLLTDADYARKVTRKPRG